MSKEYIDREAFKDEYLCCGYLPEMSEDKFDAFPAADVVEVVRCKDCKHLMFSDCYGECGKGYAGIVNPDGFCYRGERIDDE